MPVYFILIFLFILGAIVGSFLNVCIYRIPRERSILWPGSHCGNCWQAIRWYDNIPLVSYWVLRGAVAVVVLPIPSVTFSSSYSPAFALPACFTWKRFRTFTI